MNEVTPPPPVATSPEATPQPLLPTADKRITVSVAQAITITSVALGTIMTIAYAIASFMQTQRIVDELKKSSEKVENDIGGLRDKLDNLSHQIDTKTNQLTLEIAEKTGELSKQIAAKH